MDEPKLSRDQQAEAYIAQKLSVEPKAREAAATPLPGPTRDAFAIQDSITVGPYVVRPFVDRDFEILQRLEHPLHKMMMGADKDYLPQGLAAWQLAYLMTNPVKEVKKLIREKGITGFNEAAEDAFEELQLAGLTQISEAVLKQMMVYWSPVLEYGAAKKEGEVAEVRGNPSLATPMGSDGSSKSVAG